ncbi:MAG: carbon storage regulator [Planctomycetes bacterium]|nr:carbon storage regulator [Planctomycetota bacterium]
MLVLSRKIDQSIKIGENVVVKVIRMANGGVSLGIEAPDNVRILRTELLGTEQPGVTLKEMRKVIASTMNLLPGMTDSFETSADITIQPLPADSLRNDFEADLDYVNDLEDQVLVATAS